MRVCGGDERVGDARARFGEEVSVPIARHANRRVPEVRLHLFKVPSCGDEQCRARVAEVVKPDAGESRGVDRSRVVTVSEVVVVDRTAPRVQ